MPATADNLRDLHSLHQRAKALRDRLASAPKTLAAREKFLNTRREALEADRKALKDAKAQVKNREGQVQSQQARTDDLRVKLNSIKKQTEYDAIRNQIALENASISKLEDAILETMTRIDEQSAAVDEVDKEVKALEAEVQALQADIQAKAAQQKVQLEELETAITEAEQIIPADQRDRYRRTVKQRGADALAIVENGACTGCFVSVTPQMLNDLINAESLVFCNTCGRILYLAEEDLPEHRRSGR